MKIAFETRGFRELDTKLSKLAKAIPEQTQLKILTEAGGIIAEEARQLVPVRTGNLRDSITVSDQRLGGAFKMDAGLSADSSVQVFIGPRTHGGPPDGFYGHMVEFGTVKMAAEPFMRPAFDNTEGQVRSRIVNDLQMQIEIATKGR